MKLHIKITVSVSILTMCLTTSCAREETPPEPAYTPVPTVIEPGLAYHIPCKPPCWRGLVPGQSTREDVAQAMERLRAEGWANRISEGSTGCYVYPSPSLDGYIHVIVNDDGIVTKIEGRTLFYHPVGSLVEQFGNPEGLLLEKGSTTCTSCEEWEPPDPLDAYVMSFPARILYPSQGLQFSILIPSNGLGCVCPEMRVSGFSYCTPVSMQELLNEMNREQVELYPDAGLPEITLDDLVEWHGFGGGY